jgi:CO dehydrogenase maturation factor
MIKTTPPGRGSVLLDLGTEDDVLNCFAVETGGVRHLAAGAFDEADIGVSCFHSTTGRSSCT